MTTVPTGIDTWEMVFAHKIYRRELRILPGIIRAVADADRPRTRLVSDHLHRIAAAVHDHHEAEDELVWPLMLQRVIPPDSEVVVRMESQHQRLAVLLDRLDELNAQWRASASAAARDELADVLAQASTVLDEHLDDEERSLLPLVPDSLTPAEWETFNVRARSGMVAKNPKTSLIQLGFALEDATPREKELIMSALPAPIRLAWKLYGFRAHQQFRDRLRQG
ncbi:hemerythrin domain-containing protein [Kineosporia babensis]|uniref:Hemerythrin domain-containing protein n=1 Tax=Kineosporia babensis TaxID=499548 RepID=A0A9X1NB74_9ACTN|nr:hemerythrin domain-containing protein [Kineosporia babensis]MCD5310634.1 hemerythrin domain-containing protein [Kineosporia babensis]